MRGRRTTSAVLANPILVGAVTVLVIVVAVFLAYNANNGLPFVPTFELRADVPNGAQLVAGNEVREGGHRIGVVSEIDPKIRKDRSTGAELVLKLDKDASPLPADSSIRIRPRSALGLKYVELHRGTSADTLPDGSTITVGEQALSPELQEFFNIFDRPTRENSQRNLLGYGDAFAFRGLDLNHAIEALPRFLGSVPPVMSNLADPSTHLARLFTELGDAARISAPIARQMADGFRAGADTFDALSRDPQALKDTIAESPATLATGTTALAQSRPFLHSLASISDELRGAAAELRRSAPTINSTLRAGIGPLRQTPALNARLGTSFDALAALGRAPGTNLAGATLNETMLTLNPTLRFLGPYITVCNYWNYTWTLLAEHFDDIDQTGEIERVRAKQVSKTGPDSELGSYGASQPFDGYHGQYYGAAIDKNGQADCETGQRGYPRHIAAGLPNNQNIATDPETPGDQGTTYTGRPSVPKGETFSAIPEGAPKVRP